VPAVGKKKEKGREKGERETWSAIAQEESGERYMGRERFLEGESLERGGHTERIHLLASMM
jgi:hypothetical protein